MKNKLKKRLVKTIEKRSVNLPNDITLPLRNICGPSWWDTLSRGEKVAAGIYIRRLVTQHKLPLMDMGKAPYKNREYRRK
jgi:hypothetical protein